MFHKALLATVFAVPALTAIPAWAQRGTYDADRSRYLTTVRQAYFGLGCGVVTEMGVKLIIGSQAESLAEAQMRLNFIDSSIGDDVHDAAEAGTRQASSAENCSYWRQHPDDAAALRNATGMATK